MLLLLHSSLCWVIKRPSQQEFSSLFVVLRKTQRAGKANSLELLKIVYCKRFSVSFEFVVSSDKDDNMGNNILNIFNNKESVFSQRKKKIYLYLSLKVRQYSACLQTSRLAAFPCSLYPFDYQREEF